MEFDNFTPSQWFQEQLRASGYGFIWAVKQIPIERQNEIPPQQLGEWTAARHVFHLLYHEKTSALPRIKQWLGGESPIIDRSAEQMAWENSQENIESMLEHFLDLCFEQIRLASQFNGDEWSQPKEVKGWGLVNLHWVFSKNYQHTAEHIHDVLRLALFWDRSINQNGKA